MHFMYMIGLEVNNELSRLSSYRETTRLLSRNYEMLAYWRIGSAYTVNKFE